MIGESAMKPDIVKKYAGKEIDGYSGAFCPRGNTLYIRTPDIKKFYPIECPDCGFVVNLFCGKHGNKIDSEFLRGV